MPANQSSLALAEEYRTEQLTIRQEFWAALIALWLLRRDSAVPVPQWIALVIALVQRYRSISELSGQRYVAAARRLDVGEVGPVVSAGEMSDEQIVRTLFATGFRLLNPDGRQPDSHQPDSRQDSGWAEQNRFNAMMGNVAAMSTLVLDGGRAVTGATLTADSAAVGWMRVTDSDPCSFCAMLASRGAVYTSRKAAGGTDERHERVAEGSDPLAFTSEEWHPGCGCAVVPTFTTNPVLPQASIEADRLWKVATKGVRGRNAALNAFRRAMEGRPFDDDPINRID